MNGESSNLASKSGGSTHTITANARLARELRLNYDRQQAAAGLVTWVTPDILPLSVWLTHCWNNWLYLHNGTKPLQLLLPSQERAIWEEIIIGSDEGRSLLQVAATADAALDAWNLICGWQLSLSASEWGDSHDTEAFRRWASEFRRRCETKNWLSGARLPEFVAGAIDDEKIPVPDRMVLAGFNEITPAQELVLGALRRKGCRIERREIAGSAQRNAVRVGLLDGETEIRAAAQWARRLVEKTAGKAEARIGIIVPDLSKDRSQIERIFADEFHPNGRLSPEHDSQRAFNISLGLALSQYPLIYDAFLILQAHPSAIPLEDASRLLRSPFIGGAQTEYTQRARLDAKVRELREPEVSVTDIVSRARTSTSLLIHAFTEWKHYWDSIPPSQMPSDWASSFSRLLNAMGWPGERPLSSSEYQTTTVWKEVLSEFASLDIAIGSVRFGKALAMLERLAASRQFQPESQPAPVQILGVFESSGLEFDDLWIMGMHDGAWPKAASPNPFVPLRLQREKNMPHSSAQRELDFTQLLTEQLLRSAGSVVVSCPRHEADSDLRFSPLFAGLEEITEERLGLSSEIGYPEQLRRSARTEALEDHMAPRWDGTLRRGGTAIFAHQAACPFRAFAQLRLGADALDSAQPGLSPLDRGILIHEVLERVWAELRSHQGLMSVQDNALKTTVRNAVQGSIADMASKKRALRQSRFAAIEQFRLERIVTEWLELEKQRQPFTVLRQEEERQVTIGGIDLTIRADRVDRLDDGTFVVIDYKSGEHSPSEWDGDRPEDPQLPLYATASEAALSGVFFGILKVGKSRFTGLAISETVVPKVKPRLSDIPFPERVDAWRGILQRLATDFRDGNAKVDPKNPQKTCKYCSLPGLCRIGEADRPEENDSEEARA